MVENVSTPASPFAVQQALLAEQLQRLLADLYPELRADVLLALQAPGKLLSTLVTPADSHDDERPLAPVLPAGVWPLLTLLLAQYLAPESDPLPACRVALAVECFICALDLLDDVEDGDTTAVIEVTGIPRVLNVSTTLLALAQRAILSLTDCGAAPEHILALLTTLQAASLTATAGQHQDLLAEQKPVEAFDQETCMAIAAGKAGALMRLACLLGAICAGASEQLCEQCATLGELLGIAHQLDNDCHDLSAALYRDATPGQRVKTDLQRGKKTLPVVLAAAARKTALQEQTAQADEKIQENERRALREGILATWGLCLLYRERARDCLQEIAASCSRPTPPALRLLLRL